MCARLREMTNDDEATQQRAERARKRKRREDDFESFVWKAFENVFAAAKLVYKTIEDILGKAEHMEQQIEALEAAMTQVEAEEGTVAAGVQTAVAAIGKLNEEIQGLEAGEPVEEAKIEALTTRAQALLSGLTQVANTLPSVSVPDETPPAAKEEGSAAGGGEGGTGQPTQALYVHTGTDQVDTTQWPESGFETTDEPPVPLYYYSGDSSPGDTNGQNIEGWSLYTGATQPVAKDSAGDGAAS